MFPLISDRQIRLCVSMHMRRPIVLNDQTDSCVSFYFIWTNEWTNIYSNHLPEKFNFGGLWRRWRYSIMAHSKRCVNYSATNTHRYFIKGIDVDESDVTLEWQKWREKKTETEIRRWAMINYIHSKTDTFCHRSYSWCLWFESKWMLNTIIKIENKQKYQFHADTRTHHSMCPYNSIVLCEKCDRNDDEER